MIKGDISGEFLCDSGHFTILKCIVSFGYLLDLPSGVNVHPIFHVSCLKGLLGFEDNIVTIKGLAIHE